ncbi:MAG: aldo/keto reductase [Planctomycetota bacterium]|nr:MAG: aldo/keto reductase [Planctomycetota bacterium]
MEYHALGRSGLRVPRLALGTWLTLARIPRAEAAGLVAAALEAGINFFDTADVYDRGGAEEVLGELLAPHRREHLVVATKAFHPMSDDPNDRGLSRKHLFESVHASLRRLRTDYLDLFQFHRFDPETPLEETIRAVGDLIRQGKVLYWGTSMWSASQLRVACRLADELGVPRPISEQPRFNMLCREIEAEVLPACRELGIGLLFWSPLAQGLLTGKYRRGQAPPAGSRGADPRRVGQFLDRALASDEVWDRVERVLALADRAGVPPAVLAVAWCLRRAPEGTVLLGASRVEQLRELVPAATMDWPEGLEEALEEALAGPPLKL